MRTMKSAVWALAFVISATCLGGAASAGEGEPAKNVKRGKAREWLLSGKWAQRIDARIARIQARLAKHPNAPAEVKAAADKLVADLTAKKGILTKLAAAVQAKDKDAAKAGRAELRQERQQIRADRQALRQAVRAAFQARRGKAKA
jgi:hypothetical protein